MSALSGPKNAISDALTQADDGDKDTSYLRLAIAVYVATMVTLGGLVSAYVKKAGQQTFALAKTLAVLVVVYGLYWSMTRLVTGLIGAAVHHTIEQLTGRGDVSERVANAIGFVVAMAAFYALYRVAVWSIQPALDRLDIPDPGQTSVTDYVDETRDVPEGSMADDIINDD